MALPKELHTKGGPHHFEGIFVGYEEGRVSWRVCDLQDHTQGHTHFSCDVIFNKLSAGRHAWLPHSLPPPTDVVSGLSQQHILDISGDHFAEALDLSHSACSSYMSLSTIADHGGVPVVLLCQSAHVATPVPLAAAACKGLSADLISLTTVFPDSLNVNSILLLLLEMEGLLVLAALPLDLAAVIGNGRPACVSCPAT